ncbi:MAG: hypothetical protein QM756_25945 [Polyangiaceae bacterium]
MNRHVWAALSASGLLCFLSVRVDERLPRLEVAPAAAATDPAECLRFEKTQLGKSIELEAKSSCEAKLECSLSYSVRCEDRDGKATSSTQRATNFSVAAGASETLSLSAEACKQGWTIDNVSWRCRGGTAP